jgi:hypothetical protein
MASEATDPCGSQVVLKNILFEFMFKFDHQNSSNRAVGREGGGSLSSYQPGEKGGGQEIDDQCDTIDSWGWISGPSQTYSQ